MNATLNKVMLVKERSLRYDHDFTINSPELVSAFINEVHQLDSLPVEQLVVVALDTKNKVISTMLSKGTINGSLVEPRALFQWLFMNNASRFIIAHNHPSGNTYPSIDDIQITKRIQEASKIMGIDFLDHLIIGDGYLSLNEYGEF